MNDQVDKSSKSRTLFGRVASARMDKTVVIVVERVERHPFYGKFRRQSSRFFAHDETNECRRGDIVAISPCRPLSKRKAWRVAGVVERADIGRVEDEVSKDDGKYGGEVSEVRPE